MDLSRKINMTSASKAPPLNTLCDVLYQQAEQCSDQTAYRFLNTRGEYTSALTYRALLGRASGIAQQLVKLRGERVLLLLPPGEDYVVAFFGCLLAGVVAVPLYPPKKNASSQRIVSVASNCGATVALTHRTVYENPTTDAALDIDTWIFVEDQGTTTFCMNKKLSCEDLAFLQYTSGSVGAPKGVMVSHGNIMHNLESISSFSQQDENSYGFSWLPPYHDMGLIGGILFPFYCGFTVDLMPPQAFLRSPMWWLECLSMANATVGVAPNFALDLCVEHAKPEDLERLDLGHWEVCFVGAEPVRRDSLRRFYETFKDCGFRYETFLPCYGMAESTLLATGITRDEKTMVLQVQKDAFEKGQIVSAESKTEGHYLVGCGTPDDKHHIAIVDPNTQEHCPDERIGEIWIQGPSIAKGYWNRASLTQETFGVRPKGGHGDLAYFRTGDLGFLHAGQLFVTGRLKDLMIIRGRNYYPQDLERCAEQSHEALMPNGSVCFLSENESDICLTLVLELRRSHYRTVDTSDVIQAVRLAVSKQFNLSVGRVILLKPNRLLRTSSGKVQRKAMAKAVAAGEFLAMDDWQLTAAKYEPSEKLKTTLEWIRTYAKTRINSQLIDERRSIPPHIVLDFGNRGLLGLEIPEAYGGPHFSVRESLKIVETLGAIDTTLALFVGVNNALGVRPLLQYGSESQKKTWLPLLASGRELAAFAITEPGAGANPQKMASTAQAINGNMWQLNGTKAWSGNAAWAGLIHVFAHELDDEGRRCGVSAFTVKQGTPGLQMGPESLTMGVRGMVQNSIYLQNATVEAEDLLHASGQGMAVAQDAMVRARLGIGAIAIGAMKRCAQLMVHYASKREIAQGTLLENHVSRKRLSDLTAAVTACEALVSRIADLLDAGESVPHDLFSACKILIPELAWQTVDDLMQMLGGRGYEEPNMAPRLMRDIRLLRIFEGPTETLSTYVGAKVYRQDQVLRKFIVDTWQQPGIGEVLDQAIETLHQSDREAVDQYHWCGELASWAVLWASVPEGNEEQIRAVHWGKMRFEDCLERATKVEGQVLEALELEGVVKHYSEELGLWTQRASDASRIPDPLINSDVGTVEEISHVPMAPALPSQVQQTISGDSRVESLVNWMVDQLSVMPQSKGLTIHPTSELIDLGVDSLGAVQFIDRLEAHLEIEIDPAIIWQFSTLSKLAGALVQQKISQTTWTEMHVQDVLNDTPDDELVEVLEREIALSQQMLKGV